MTRRTGIAFDRLCEVTKLPKPVAEFRFAPPRRWRFDWFWPDHNLALEVQGGLFIRGRHTQGAALVLEHEKLNEAAARGIRVLFVQPKDLESTGTYDLLRRALQL